MLYVKEELRLQMELGLSISRLYAPVNNPAVCRLIIISGVLKSRNGGRRVQ